MKETAQRKASLTLKSEIKALKNLSLSMPALLKVGQLLAQRKGEIIVTGIGKSGFIAQKIASTLTSLGQRAIFLHPVEAIHGDLGTLSDGDAILALSFSGQSREVVKLIEYAKRHFKVSIVSFTKSKKTPLGKLSDVVVELKVEKEGGLGNLAPMASTTATLVLGDMLASILASTQYGKHFAKSHPGGNLGLKLGKVRDVMKKEKSLPLVKSEALVPLVLKEMTKKGLGVTGVTKKKKLKGIITDGDLRRWLLKGGNPNKDNAQTIMTRAPKTVSPQSSLKEALSLMERKKITNLFVLNETKVPVGIIHIHDILGGNVT